MSQLSPEATVGKQYSHTTTTTLPNSTFGLTPCSSSLESTPNHGTLYNDPIVEDTSGINHDSSRQEFQGESSLFAHAVFASRFLQDAVDNSTDPAIAHEMGLVLDDLRMSVRLGKQQPDTLDKLYPYAKALPSGSTTRNLPLPPMEKVFTCLRMAKESPQIAMLWLGNFMRPSQFSDYFFKVASPGPATEADLIIVHCGLYWLFCECSKVALSLEVKQDHDAQSLLCKANIETVLANLRFHHSTSVDFAYAMGIAVRSSPSLILKG